MDVEVQPATLDRFDDVAAILGPAEGKPHGCWCLYYRLSSGEFNRVQGEERPVHVRDLCAGDQAPGVIAYRGSEPVGWCAFGPWSDMGRLQRSRTIPRIDERPRWSIVCFVVRAGYRRQGVAAALLEGAIEYATASGVDLLEAYPAETEGGRISASLAYVGTTSMFERAGFQRIQETSSRTGGRARWVMRLEL